MVTMAPRKRVLISEPTFLLYAQIATVLGGEVESVPLTSDLQYDSEALLKAVKDRQPDVTIICSPNNPTGCVLEDDALSALLKASRGLVIVDEAYHEFSEHTVVPLLHEHENLIVLRTFSKAMAFAALRLGYLLASPEVVSEVHKAVLPYSVNLFAQVAAEVAMEHYDTELRPLVKEIIAERERLFGELCSVKGLTPVASKGNFMVVKSATDPRRIFTELLEHDILVRDVSGYPMLRDYFRFSFGKPEENNQILKAIGEICG